MGTNHQIRSEDDPLYLQGSDHPGMILVTTQLHDRNYFQWKIAIETALGAKLKLGFVYGTVLEPAETDVNHNQWMRVDRMVRSWILNTISKEIVTGFWYARTAHDLWLDLKEQFGDANGPMLYKVQREICSMTQGNLSVTLYYTGLKKLWHEYQMLEPIPVCTCGVGKHIADLTTRNQLIQFLMGLNDSFDSIRDQILLLDPVPTVAKAYSMVLRVEKQRDNDVQFGDVMDQSVNLTRSASMMRPLSKTTKEVDKSGKFCTYCKETNHVKDQCFKLNGYPEWWKGKKKGPSQKTTKSGSQFAANVSEHPFEWSDSDGEKEANSSMAKGKTQVNMQTLIQQEVNKEISRLLKGKGTGTVDPGTQKLQSQFVNFVQAGEFAGPTD